MLSKNKQPREEYFRKKRKEKFIKYGTIVLLLLLILGIASYVAHRPELRIDEVILSGGVLITEDEISTHTLDYISESYLLLFPKDNSIWYPRRGLKRYLRDSFPRIDTIEISLWDRNTVSVEITERKPFAIWSHGEDNYFMDMNGTIFSPAPVFSGDAYFKYYGLVDSTAPIGASYMSSTEDFLSVSDFIDKVKKLEIKPLYLLAKEDGQFEVELAGGGKILFDTKKPLDEVFQHLSSLIETNELSVGEDGVLGVEYVDLRFGNKLFYKLRDTNGSN